MPYEIKYTDFANKGVILVEDNLINTDTSLQLPGKGATGYGKAVAESLLHLLEHFAGPNEPANPVEGQLWYDTGSEIDQLKIYDSTQWKTASGFTKSSRQPTAAQSIPGDLWVDTTTQQLFVYTGNSWLLIGPEVGSGLLTGGKSESIITTDDETVPVFTIYVENTPYLILTKGVSNPTGTGFLPFTPKVRINGFDVLKPGLNMRNENIANPNNPIKFVGVAESAKALVVETSTGSEVIQSENFLRSDALGTIEKIFRVKTNDGLKVGAEDQFSLLVSGNSVELRNNNTISSIDMILRGEDAFNTVLRVTSQKRVGINNLAPTEELDVIGDVRIAPFPDDSSTGTLRINNNTDSTNFGNGSLVTRGGVGVALNLNVGGNLDITGTTRIGDTVIPDLPNQIDIGSNLLPFKQVYADNFIGTLTGDVTGRVSGIADRANRLNNSTTFSISGDVESPSFEFDGETGGNTKTFNISIKNSFIANKTSISDVANVDEILVNKVQGSGGINSGVYKVTKRNFIKTIPLTPIGVVLPYGGVIPPFGWELCDGTVVQKSDYNELWQIVGHNFRNPTTLPDGGNLTFALPDLRGRFPLGVDNMGGTPANRVTGSIQRFTNIQGINTVGSGFNAVFTVETNSGSYTVQVTNPGEGYNLQDKILVTGNIFGGASPTHDLIITVTGITNSGIATFTATGTAFTGVGANRIGASLGSQSKEIDIQNLPDHDHELVSEARRQFYAVRSRPQAADGQGLETEPDAVNLSIDQGSAQAYQGITSTGGVDTSSGLGVPLDIMNPYLTLNYIIYTGRDQQ